jgi:hypothetical protein
MTLQAVMVGEGRPATPLPRPALQGVDGGASAIMTMMGWRADRNEAFIAPQALKRERTHNSYLWILAPFRPLRN